MKILLIDNYDSFTYNLFHLVGNFTTDITVKRNDKITIDEIIELKPDKILISPGPGRPEDSGISVELLRYTGLTVPILGVCLGHQALGYCFNAGIVNAPVLMHGKISKISHDGKTIFKDIPQRFEAGRYHSLMVDRGSLDESFEVSAWTDGDILMGIRHKQRPLEGIQFHPESILTPHGYRIIKNWLSCY